MEQASKIEEAARMLARDLADHEAVCGLAPFLTGAQAGIISDLLRAVGDDYAAMMLDQEHTEAHDPRDGWTVAVRSDKGGPNGWRLGRFDTCP